MVRIGTLFFLSVGGAWANPTGGTVAQGAAAIASSGNTLTVTQTTDRAVVNWNSFSVGAGEVTRFVQPSSTSAILNRVTGGNLSQISGSIEANGQVFLLNPNGIVFNAGSTINTAGFLGSTLNVADGEFMAGGAMNFSGPSTAKITNLGNISVSGGDIYLIAKEVENQGLLYAPGGTVGLAGATNVLLSAGGTDKLLIQPASGQGTVTNANGATIAATVASLKAVGGNEYALAVNNGGIIRATGSAVIDGRVVLLADGGTTENTGTITATNADGKGGFIETSGESVSLQGTIQTGAGGEWLIDPLVLDGSTSPIQISTLQGQLATGSVTEAATNTIVLSEALTWSGTGTLTLSTSSTTGTITLNAAITATGGGLSLSAGSTGAITDTAAVSVGTFTLTQGKWSQTGTLPTFAATDFRLNGGTFLRATSGAGTTASPYLLTDIYGLQGINGFTTSSFTLANAISASGTTTWNINTGFVPIGNTGTYSGVFNGAGFAISGLVVKSTSGTTGAGLFSSLTGGTLTGVVLTGETVSVSGATSVGGLVGKNVGGTITASYATGSVAGNTSANVGGLVGMGTSGSISSSYATGTLSGTSSTNVGGLVGSNQGTIANSYAIETETGGTATNVGGLTGTNTGAISNSYSYATIKGTASGTIINASTASTSSGLTAAQMALSSSYGTSWNFTPGTGPWGVNGYTGTTQLNGGLPYEQWQYPTSLSITASNQNVTYGSTPVTTGTLGTTYTTAGGTLATYVTGNVGLVQSGTNINAGTTNFLLPGVTVKAGAIVELLSGVETITVAPLVVTASNESKTYGAAQTLVGYGVSGLKYSDSVTAVTLAGTGASTGTSVGLYSIAASGATGTGLSNYSITYVTGTDTVNAAALTITAGNVSKTYGSSQSLTQFSVSGLENNDAVRTVSLFSTGTTATANAGSYSITPFGASGTGLSNYSISYVAGTDLVNPAVLTYLANQAARSYGTANPALSGRVSGFVLGQTQATATTGTLSFTTTATKSTDALVYGITGGGLTANNGNYVFAQAVGNASALKIVGAPQKNGVTVQLKDAVPATTTLASIAPIQTKTPSGDIAAAVARKTADQGFSDEPPFRADGTADAAASGSAGSGDGAHGKQAKPLVTVHAPGMPSSVSYSQAPAGELSGSWYSYVPNVIYGLSSGELAEQQGH